MDFITVSGVDPSTIENKLEYALNYIKRLSANNERIVDSYYIGDKPVIIAIDDFHCVWRYVFTFDKTSIMYGIELF